MNLNELKRAKSMKDRLNGIGCGFCLAKWDQVTMHLHNGMTHSCHHPAPHKVSEEELKKNFRAIHNSQEKLQQRKDMLDGERPKGCNYCYKTEDNNSDAISDRYLKSANLFEHRFDKIVNSGLGENHIPEYIEVSFNNVCNMKCLYCGPHFSSMWQSEQENNEPIMLYDSNSRQKHWEYHSLNWLARLNELPIPNNEYNPYINAWWKWWPELKKEFKILRITGGEPLMSKDTFKLFDDIKNAPMKELHLCINTNLNAPEKNWLKFIEFVKRHEQEYLVNKMTLYTSLDGWGKQAEYIRTGLDFNMLWERLLYLIETHPSIDNTMMSAYSFLSIPSYKKLLENILRIKQTHNRYNGLMEARYNNYKDWFNEHKNPLFWIRNEKPCVLHLDVSNVNFPPFLDVMNMDRELTLPYLWDQYSFMMHNLTLGEDNRNFYDYEAEKIGRIVDLAYYSGKDQNEQNEKNLLQQRNFQIFIENMDQRRGTDFCKTFPEFEEFYKRKIDV